MTTYREKYGCSTPQCRFHGDPEAQVPAAVIPTPSIARKTAYETVAQVLRDDPLLFVDQAPTLGRDYGDLQEFGAALLDIADDLARRAKETPL